MKNNYATTFKAMTDADLINAEAIVSAMYEDGLDRDSRTIDAVRDAIDDELNARPSIDDFDNFMLTIPPFASLSDSIRFDRDTAELVFDLTHSAGYLDSYQPA